MGRVPFSLRAYAGLSRLLHPAVPLLLDARRRRGKEDPERLAERRGIASLPRPEGMLVWLHGASVGELVSLLPLAEYLTDRGIAVLVTSGTVTSAEVASRRLPEGAVHQFVPLDLPAYVSRFLDHWRPDIGVFAESELWPNLVGAAHERGARLVIVNARMSERSFRRWGRLPGFIGSMLSRFELVLAQSEPDAARLRERGARGALSIGNIKYDVAPPPADPVKLEALRDAIGGRPVFVAASTHPGEEEPIGEAHLIAKAAHPALLTILIPRHPERGAEAAAILAARGLLARRRSEGLLPEAATDIYVADTIGEIGLFYRLARLAYLGGSMTPRGGQNPIEPAKLGSAILHGPNVRNFLEVYASLSAAGGAAEVRNGATLGEAVARLLGDARALDTMARSAGAAVQAMGGANRRIIEALEHLLMQAQADAAAP